MFGLIDNKTGKVIFETDGNYTLNSELEMQEQLGREFPKTSNYVFKNSDGKQVEYTIVWQDEIEVTNRYKDATDEGRKMFDAINVNPVYIRIASDGSLTPKFIQREYMEMAL